MAKPKIDKKITALEAIYENILVCNNRALRPFIEIFAFEPENSTQKSLGNLFGVLEVTDTSEDSSYIVNYLSSIIKKEYFSKPKRSPIESFEAALHKANLALAKLAEHGNIKWTGKLNALIAIIEKNNLHIAQTGTASAFLFRAKGLTDISEGLSTDEAQLNPLKTFMNVSSGRLESQDKLIITTEEIFDIFSLEEIKKSILRFPKDKFLQFLKTALINELDSVAVLIADIQKRVEAPIAPTKKVAPINAFSQAAFRKEPARANHPVKDTVPARKNISAEIQEEIRESQDEFTDEQSGHIYIKETLQDNLDSKEANEFFNVLLEYLQSFFKKIKITLKSLGLFLFTTTKNISISTVNLIQRKIEARKLAKKTAPEAAIKSAPEKIAPEKSATAVSSFSLAKIQHFFSNLIPNFSRLKVILSKLDYQQRLYAILIVFAIFGVPYLGLKIEAYIQSKKIKPLESVAEVIVVPLAQDKSVTRLGSLNAVYASSNIAAVLNLNDKFFSLSQANITDLESKTEFPIPQDFGQIKLATAMNDLNLIFLLNDKKQILSFSPTTKKFQANSIIIPENSHVTAIGTYLTYLYLIDSTNNQIYRYPRAEGGFGASASWLKDSIDLSQITDMSLSDNIFIADNKNILKLFKGKKQDFNIENTATPIVPFKVFTKPDSQSVFILDKQNSRIIKLDLNGAILAQYYNAEIGNATNFTIDEKTNTAYIANSSEIKSFNIN